MILHDKIYRNITMPDHAKISGYTPEAAAKMLQAFDSCPVKGGWRKHTKIVELEYYQCEITWLSESHVVLLIKYEKQSFIHSFISFSKIVQKFKIIYTYTLKHRHTQICMYMHTHVCIQYMHMRVYIYT